MKRVFLFCSLILLFGAGCASSIQAPTNAINQATSTSATSTSAVNSESAVSTSSQLVVMLPIREYAERRTLKWFGKLVHDRFDGYHLGDDIEYTDATGTRVEVYAFADGKIVYLDPYVSGYGGVLTMRATVDGKIVNALYGHLDLRKPLLKVGDSVARGYTIAILGEGGSYQTDGERKHLHFSLYPGIILRLQGYASNKSMIANWIDPQVFFTQNGVSLPTHP